jgi:DNA-binding MarR family transcriptional regulator
MSINETSHDALPVRLSAQGNTVRVYVAGADIGLRLQPLRVESLTLRLAEQIDWTPDTLVRFRRASSDAKRFLRDHGIAYASDAGEVFILDPPVAIHQGPPRTPQSVTARRETGSPFANKASRVSRWLLNHASERFNIRQLARHTHLSEAAVSNTVRSLDEQMLLSVVGDRDDKRLRWVQLERPGALLEAWADTWERRRLQTLDWDIGSADVEETLNRLPAAESEQAQLRWALGGTAGAAALVRAVEPAEVAIWVMEEDLPTWEALLVPTPSRGRRGSLRLGVAPDPYLFELSSVEGDVRVADPAQIYLDCVREGERALEAADAVRERMGW